MPGARNAAMGNKIARFETKEAAKKAVPKNWQHKILIKRVRSGWLIAYVPDSIFPAQHRVLQEDGTWGRLHD